MSFGGRWNARGRREFWEGRKWDDVLNEFRQRNIRVAHPCLRRRVLTHMCLRWRVRRVTYTSCLQQHRSPPVMLIVEVPKELAALREASDLDDSLEQSWAIRE